jgi:hypothetical protein
MYIHLMKTLHIFKDYETIDYLLKLKKAAAGLLKDNFEVLNCSIYYTYTDIPVFRFHK